MPLRGVAGDTGKLGFMTAKNTTIIQQGNPDFRCKEIHHSKAIFQTLETANNGNFFRAKIATRNLENENSFFKFDKLNLETYLTNPVILYEHGHDLKVGNRPVGRTLQITRHGNDLIADFELFDQPADVRDVKQMWQNQQLAGASIGWSKIGEEQALIEWSLVSVPMDSQALRLNSKLEKKMEDEAIYKVKTKEKSVAAKTENAGTEAPAAMGAMGEEITRLNQLLNDLDAAVKELRASSAEPDEQEICKEEANLESAAIARADLIVAAKDLMGDDFDCAGKSPREIMTEIVGDSVKDAKNKSDDYLLACVHNMQASRHKQREKLRSTEQKASNARVSGGVPIDVMGIIGMALAKKSIQH